MDLDDLVAKWQPDIEPAIRRTCAKWRVRGADAEDLASELWLCLLRQDGRVLRRFEGRSSKRTYLFRVLNGAAHDWMQKGAARRRLEVSGGDTYDAYATRLAGGESPETEARHHARLRALLAALRHLDPVDRAIMCQRLSGHTPSAMARANGLSVAAVQHRIYRAIPRLRDLITFAAHRTGEDQAGRQAGRHHWCMSDPPSPIGAENPRVWTALGAGAQARSPGVALGIGSSGPFSVLWESRLGRLTRRAVPLNHGLLRKWADLRTRPQSGCAVFMLRGEPRLMTTLWPIATGVDVEQ
jgi:RNA polymerase sigma factor (sigma-70 family)